MFENVPQNKQHPEIQLSLVKGTHSQLPRPVEGDLYIDGSIITSKLSPGVINDGWNKMHVAAWNGDIAGVQAALAEGINHIAGNNNGWQPIHLAAQQGHTAVVDILLKVGGLDRVKCGNELGWTPLHAASWGGHPDVINLLVDYGIDARQGNTFGWNSAHVAAWNGKQNSLDILKYKVGFEVGNQDGWNTIHLATWNNKLHLVQWLVEECNVDLESGNVDWWHPLHIAAWLGKIGIAEFLFNKEASIVAGSATYGITPVQLAEFKEYVDILDIFHVPHGEVGVEYVGDL